MRDGLRRAATARPPEGAAMRRLWAGSLVLTLAGWVGLTPAQDLRWQPAPASPAPAVTLGPPVALGRPVPASPARPVVRGQSPDDGTRLAPWSAAPPQADDLGGALPVIPPLQLPPPITPASATV